MIISLTINDVPDYLKESKLYENIESDDSFDIPIEYFKKELVINTFDDLVSYIKIFDYWIMNKTPNEIYKFVFDNKDKINMDLLNDQFPINDLIKQIKIIINTPINNLSNICSSHGYLDLLIYIHKYGNSYYWDIDTFMLAAENGNLECLKYLNENDGGWDHTTCHSAARYGHLDCLKYAHENNCPWNEDLDNSDYSDEWESDLYEGTCSSAAENGHLDCLKYAHENGCDWYHYTCSFAAGNGHLECLKYAHRNGCEWNSYTCESAARNGHLECLKYAHENGCEWNSNSFSEAIKNGHLECAKYIYDKGCYMYDLPSDTFSEAIKNGHLECAKYIYEKGYYISNHLSNDSMCRIAAKNGHLECVKYIHSISVISEIKNNLNN